MSEKTQSQEAIEQIEAWMALPSYSGTPWAAIKHLISAYRWLDYDHNRTKGLRP